MTINLRILSNSFSTIRNLLKPQTPSAIWRLTNWPCQNKIKVCIELKTEIYAPIQKYFLKVSCLEWLVSFESTTTSGLLLGLRTKPRAPGVHRACRTTCRVPRGGWRAPAWTASPLVLPPPSLRRTLARLPHCLLAKRVPWEGVAGAALDRGLLVGFQVNLILVASKKPQSCRGHGDSIW